MSDRGAVITSGDWNPGGGTGYPYSGQAGANQYFHTFRTNTGGGVSGSTILRNDVSTYLNYDNFVASGAGPNVPASADTSPNVTYIYTFISGTVSPDQTSSWYQWTSGGVPRSSIPNNQISAGQIMASGIGVSGNPIYNYPSNQGISKGQFSGAAAGQTLSGTFSANVPTSESSWNV